MIAIEDYKPDLLIMLKLKFNVKADFFVCEQCFKTQERANKISQSISKTKSLPSKSLPKKNDYYAFFSVLPRSILVASYTLLSVLTTCL